ncbi:MAG: hypothetical protein ACRCX8_18415 [Sarcina sp.]
MANVKSGVSMGRIKKTRSKKDTEFFRHINNIKKKNAKICQKCESNKEGYCEKHKAWCNKVNYICNGFDSHYYDHFMRPGKKKENSKNNSNNKPKPRLNKGIKNIEESNPFLGQVIKTNFSTTEYTRRKDLKKPTPK